MKHSNPLSMKMWKRTAGKRFLSFLLAGSMLAGSVPSSAISAFAEYMEKTEITTQTGSKISRLIIIFTRNPSFKLVIQLQFCL